MFAEVEKGRVAVVGAEEQEPASAEIAGYGMDDGESEAGGYSGVDGVASGFEDLEAGVGGEVMDADDHSVFGADGLLAAIVDDARLLG